MSEEKVQETRQLKLDTPVVVRKVPMTGRGCDLLRTIREYQIELYSQTREAKVEIPFPTSIHLLMEEFVKLKGLEVKSK